jgi:hypothetical protein
MHRPNKPTGDAPACVAPATRPAPPPARVHRFACARRCWTTNIRTSSACSPECRPRRRRPRPPPASRDRGLEHPASCHFPIGGRATPWIGRVPSCRWWRARGWASRVSHRRRHGCRVRGRIGAKTFVGAMRTGWGRICVPASMALTRSGGWGAWSPLHPHGVSLFLPREICSSALRTRNCCLMMLLSLNH